MTRGEGIGGALRRLVPVLAWAPRYERAHLRADVLAGLTTAVMLVPQGMGYALLAGLPPVVGLYASFAPLLVYAAFGTSPQLAVGPVAMDSILVATAVGAIAATGTEDYVAYAALLASMVGAFQLAMGIARAGFVVNFLSRPVMTGFTAAAALIIGASQLAHLLGVSLPSTHRLDLILARALAQAADWHLPTLSLGGASIAAMALLKRRWPTFPGALAAVAVTTAAVAGLGLAAGGVAIVGEVPRGIPSVHVPRLDLETMTVLAPAAFTIALVAFMEAISVSKALGRQHGYDVAPNQELGALGLANVAAGFFGGYPITGGLSRSAVNARAGARTQLAAVVTALVIGLTLVLFAGLFRSTPKAVLAAIVLTAVASLVDLAEMKRLWVVKRADFALMVLTFVATLTLGIQSGILVGVGASVLWFAVQTTRPHFAVVGRVPGTESYLNLDRHPHAITVPGVLVVRIDAQFYFGNVSFLKETIARLEAEARAEGPLEVIVLEAGGVNQLDSSAAAALEELDADLASRGIRLFFSRVKGPVRDVMARSGYLQRLGAEGRVFMSTHHAVQHACGHRCAPRERDARAVPDRIGCGPFPVSSSEGDGAPAPPRDA